MDSCPTRPCKTYLVSNCLADTDENTRRLRALENRLWYRASVRWGEILTRCSIALLRRSDWCGWQVSVIVNTVRICKATKNQNWLKCTETNHYAQFSKVQSSFIVRYPLENPFLWCGKSWDWRTAFFSGEICIHFSFVNGNFYLLDNRNYFTQFQRQPMTKGTHSCLSVHISSDKWGAVYIFWGFFHWIGSKMCFSIL